MEDKQSKKLSKQAKIAVVLGGKSKERPGSLISGKAVYESLKKQGYTNTFLLDPLQQDFIQRLLGADTVFLILHGRYGEDGKIQGFLDTAGIPYIGSGVLASATGMDKRYFKLILQRLNIRTPDFDLIIPQSFTNQYIDSIVSKFGLPLFLKPISEGGSLGSGVIHSKEQLIAAIMDFTKQGFDGFLAEKFIQGRTLTVGLLEINEKLKVLPILETISKKEFYDYEAKHDPKLHIYECPARISGALTKAIQNVACEVYRAIGFHGFCRIDFILGKDKSVYVLEANTLPGMSEGGNMATMAKASNINYDRLVLYLLRTAFTRPVYLP